MTKRLLFAGGAFLLTANLNQGLFTNASAPSLIIFAPNESLACRYCYTLLP